MLFLSILLLLSSNAVTSRRDKSILYARLVITILILCVILSLNSYYTEFHSKGLGLFGGLYQTTAITHCFHIFVFVIAALILQLNGFYPWKTWTADFNSGYKLINYYCYILKKFKICLKQTCVWPSQANLILILFSINLSIYIFGIDNSISNLNFLYYFCGTFFLIVMFTNIIYKENNKHLRVLILSIFSNPYSFIKNFWNHIKKIIFKLLIILIIMVFIGFILGYCYNFLFEFKREDCYFLHIKRLLFISPWMLVTHHYISNWFINKKLSKFMDALKNITLTRFIFILFSYTLLSYFGIGEWLWTYTVVILFEIKFPFLDLLNNIAKMHSLTHSLFNKIVYCFKGQRNFMQNSLIHSFLKNPCLVKIDYYYSLNKIKRSNFIRSILFEPSFKLKSKSTSISSTLGCTMKYNPFKSICLMIDPSIFYITNLSPNNKLSFSNLISTERFISVVTNNRLLISSYDWDIFFPKSILSNGHYYAVLRLGNYLSLISSDITMINFVNKTFYLKPLDKVNYVYIYNTDKPLLLSEKNKLNSLEVSLFNLNINQIGSSKQLVLNAKDRDLIKLGNKDPNIDFLNPLVPLNMPFHSYQDITVNMMRSQYNPNANRNDRMSLDFILNPSRETSSVVNLEQENSIVNTEQDNSGVSPEIVITDTVQYTRIKDEYLKLRKALSDCEFNTKGLDLIRLLDENSLDLIKQKMKGSELFSGSNHPPFAKLKNSLAFRIFLFRELKGIMEQFVSIGETAIPIQFKSEELDFLENLVSLEGWGVWGRSWKDILPETNKYYYIVSNIDNMSTLKKISTYARTPTTTHFLTIEERIVSLKQEIEQLKNTP